MNLENFPLVVITDAAGRYRLVSEDVLAQLLATKRGEKPLPETVKEADFGLWLGNALKVRSLSQARLARLAHVTQKTISKIVTHETNLPKRSIREKISRAIESIPLTTVTPKDSNDGA